MNVYSTCKDKSKVIVQTSGIQKKNHTLFSEWQNVSP